MEHVAAIQHDHAVKILAMIIQPRLLLGKTAKRIASSPTWFELTHQVHRVDERNALPGKRRVLERRNLNLGKALGNFSNVVFTFCRCGWVR